MRARMADGTPDRPAWFPRPISGTLRRPPVAGTDQPFSRNGMVTDTLRGKTLFITGASRGIGLAIALRAARDGANVVIAAKTEVPHPKLPGTIYTAASEIEAAGGKALPCVVDVRDEGQVEAAVARAVETFGGIDILVNNASA